MKQTAPLCFWIDENKHFHLFLRLTCEKQKHIKRVGRFHFYFTHNTSFKRAIEKLLEVSEEWLIAGYCERSADVLDNPYNAKIEIKSTSTEHFKLQLACVQCWINAQDDLLADMLISQGDGENED